METSFSNFAEKRRGIGQWLEEVESREFYKMVEISAYLLEVEKIEREREKIDDVEENQCGRQSHVLEQTKRDGV